MESKESGVTQSQVAEAAYYLWLKRGGSDIDNWLEAEMALKSSRRA